MAENLLEGSEGEDGLGVKVFADADEASFQRANRLTEGLKKGLSEIAKLDFSPLNTSIKAIAAGLAGAGVATVKLNTDEVQNMLKAVKAGVSNEDFKRWTSVELQLQLGKGSITKDLATIYEQMNRIKSLGDLNKDQFLALGLLGVNADKFIDEKNNSQRLKTLLAAALSSDKDAGTVAALVDQAAGTGTGDLYRMLKQSGIPLEQLLSRLTVFTGDQSQSDSLAFNSEYQVAVGNIAEMSRLLASAFGTKLTPFIQDFNNWVDKYQGVLKKILSLQSNWLDDLWSIASGKITDPMNKFANPRANSEEGFALSRAGQAELDTYKDYLKAKSLFALNNGKFSFAQLTGAGLSPRSAMQLGGDAKTQRATLDNYFKGIDNPDSILSRKIRDALAVDAVMQLYNNVLSKKSLIGKGNYTGGYKSSVDFSNLRKSEVESINSVDEHFDQVIGSALIRLRNDPGKFNELMKLATEAETVKGSSIPGLDPSLKDTQFYTESAFNRLMQFLEKSNVFEGNQQSSVNINNNVELAFGGSAPSPSEATDLGNRIGSAIGEKIKQAIGYSDLAVGDLG